MSFSIALRLLLVLIVPTLLLVGAEIMCHETELFKLENGVLKGPVKPSGTGVSKCTKCAIGTCKDSSGNGHGEASCADNNFCVTGIICDGKDKTKKWECKVVCEKEKCNNPEDHLIPTTTTTTTTTMESTTEEDPESETTDEEPSTQGQIGEGSTHEKVEESTNGKKYTGDGNNGGSKTTPEGNGGEPGSGAQGGVMPVGILIGISIIGGAVGFQLVNLFP